MIHSDPLGFAITSFQLSHSMCGYKMPSWWVVSWLVGAATKPNKTRNFSAEKENAASWQLAASRCSIFGPCPDRGLTQLTPTGASHQARSIGRILRREAERKQPFCFPVSFRWQWRPYEQTKTTRGDAVREDILERPQDCLWFAHGHMDRGQ